MRSNPRETTRPYDRFELERYSASLQWERDFSDDTKMVTSLWASYYLRWSSRQTGGGFGLASTSLTNAIQNQKFFTFGLEQRWIHNYDFGSGNHTLSSGVQLYRSISPRKDSGPANFLQDSDRTITYLPVFVENKFSWGPFSITPGVRFENAKQSIRENENTNKAADKLGSASDRIFVPVFGVGAAYELAPKIELYLNASESYRPKLFTQSVPTGANQDVPSDLSEASAWQYEVGLKGRPQPWIHWDTSVFLLDFDNQIGTVTDTTNRKVVKNTGRAQHFGIELSGEIDLLALTEQVQRRSDRSRVGVEAVGGSSKSGSLNLYGNVTLLDAEYVSGNNEGKTPAYASRYILRSGIVYRSSGERLRVAITSSFVGKSFAFDSNAALDRVPSYAVWDLTGEAKIYRDSVSLTWGVNNLFDKNYFSRITDTGIDPGQGRNFYGGLSLKF
jgi:Fe(3+) dicitrate transport protein